LTSAPWGRLVASWSIPVVFITSLVSVDSLSKHLPFLVDVIEIKVVKSLLQGTVPAVVLAQLLGLLPVLLKFTTTYQVWAWALQSFVHDRAYFL
jgi:hypothetical protein